MESNQEQSTQEFIKNALHTKSKFLDFLVYWLTTFCIHHEIDLIQALSHILNHLILKQNEQKPQPLEFDSIEETKEK